ncbi:MAG TPA: type III-A CRISPR-associated RAMP protein Csm4 [Bryobacteraceae bacterium]|nr:type III-A CRISPR-associated RAMP protein Csm4 [Bryobacteraceae bacterium]
MIVHLHPTGPWRIGPDSGDRDRVDRIFHSDTLYSAISSAMARLGMIEDWLDATARAAKPAVRFSSCFPFQGETMFVVPPRSLWPPPPSAKVRWKGARFVPLSVVEDLIHGRPLAEEGWTVDGASECLVPIGSQGGSQGPFRVSVRSNAAVDRHGAGVEPHSSACLEFAPGAGLWMTAEFANDETREKWKAPVTSALRLLVDSGFGGERSRGWGRATLALSDNGNLVKPPAEASGATAWWMLSLFHPSSEDSVDWNSGDYSLTTRGGRVESDARWGDAKKPTRMVAEGSVIVAGSEPRGAAPDVAPEDFPHPVYRAGFALAIPIPWRQPA